MTVHDERDTDRSTTVPRPRTPGQVGDFPWPEPWRRSAGARPRSEYWDVRTASWRSRGPVPPPRSGE
jgi:hypothetical protein